MTTCSYHYFFLKHVLALTENNKLSVQWGQGSVAADTLANQSIHACMEFSNETPRKSSYTKNFSFRPRGRQDARGRPPNVQAAVYSWSNVELSSSSWKELPSRHMAASTSVSLPGWNRGIHTWESIFSITSAPNMDSHTLWVQRTTMSVWRWTWSYCPSQT
jgi:hypothetical protein